MVRWKYLVPRLIIVTALLFILLVCVDPVARWVLVSAGQATTGARVDIGGVSTSPFLMEAAITDVQVANPWQPDTNLVEFDTAWVDVDGRLLARKQLVVRDAAVSGLIIGADRLESGRLEKNPDESGGGFQLGGAAVEWLESTGKMLQGDIQHDLESPPMAREMGDRWPEEYKQLEERVEAWLARAKALEDLPNQIKDGDIVSQASRVRDGLLEVQELRTELASLRTDLTRLRRQVQVDRIDLQDAVTRDRQKIRERISLKHLDRDSMSDYLLGRETSERLRQITGWIKSTREAIPDAPTVTQPQRGRGTTVPFEFYDPQPDFLVKRVQLDGEIHTGGRAYAFAGVGRGFTHQPKQYGEPVEMRLKLDQPAETWIELTIDRTGEVPVDQLTVICPRFPMQPREWGDAGQLAVQVPAGELKLQLQMILQGDRLSGNARVQRSGLQLTPLVSDDLGGESVARRVATAVADIDELDVELSLAGTLDEPTYEVHTELGTQLADGIRLALADEIAHQRAKIEAKVQAELDEQLAVVTSKIDAEQQKVFDKLQLADGQQSALQNALSIGGSRSVEEVGRDLIRGIFK